MKIAAILFSLASLALSSGTAFSSTVLVTSDPHIGTTTTFTDTGNNGFGNPGPTILDGFSVTGNPQVTYGNANYNIGSNGQWNQSWIATNSIGSITFNLGGAYSFVGGLMNYGDYGGPDPTVTALGTDGATVIGTYDLVTMAPISTPGAINGEAFRGIESSSANIGYFRLSGDFILAHSIEVGGTASPVPEPSSLLLITSGLLGAAGAVRRKLFN